MVKTIRTFFLSFTILAFLLFSTIGTTTVYADDGTGIETSETTPAPEEEQPSEPVTDEGQPADPGTEEAPPPVDEGQPPVEPATEVTVEVILEQVPENTTVTVLNSEGEAIPLASQESADAIASDYDPIWCPAGQVPTPGEFGCTPSFDSFTELLTFLQANEGDIAYQQAGTIYIQQGAYLGGESEIDFNNYEFETFDQYDLTLQGGWDTAYEPADGDPTYTETTFNAPIIIGSSTNPWLGSLTINNIAIDGVSNQTGLTIYTTDVINFNKVEVTNSQSGIDLDAGEEISLVNVNASNNETYGASIKGDKVAIDTANFSNNGSGSDLDPTGSGLEINSINDVALIYVTANNNQLFGANIVSSNVVAVEHSTFSGNFVYAYTGQDDGYGLRVVTTATIAVDDVTANNNNQYGAYLQGGNIAVENSSFTANGSGVVTDPTGYGLQIVGSGEVQVLSVTANNNQFFGADVKAEKEVTVLNSFFSGHQSVLPEGVDNDICSGYQVEVADWVDFDFCGYGLKVVTPDDIFLNSVTGNFNNLWGAWLDGNNVSVYNSQFNNNETNSRNFIDDTGMLIFASGEVDIFRTEARDNRLYGAIIEAESFVSIVQSYFTGNQGFICLDMWCNVREYYGVGLDVTTPDLIFMRDTEVSNNNLFGALLNGSLVTVVNSIFNNNAMGDGLIINATDNVTLTGVTAVNNDGNGVEVDGVCQKIVQVNGGTFSDNALFGLSVLNATLALDGTQIFVNNGSDDFFASPCVVVTTTSSNQLESPAISTNPDPGTETESTTGTDVTTNTADEGTPPTTPADTSLEPNSTVVEITTSTASNQATSPTISKNTNQGSGYAVIEVLRKWIRARHDNGFILWNLYRTMWDSLLFRELWQFIHLNGGFEFGRMIMPK